MFNDVNFTGKYNYLRFVFHKTENNKKKETEKRMPCFTSFLSFVFTEL